MTETDSDGDGDADTSVIHHEVDSANELLEVVRNGLSTPIRADPAGNLTADTANNTNYVYQYDGLYRLVQVNHKGTAFFDSDGRIVSGQLGALIFALTYDGVGRVIRKELPESPTNTQLRIEDYYYDGVRRIQDVIRRPLAVPPPPACEPEPVTKEASTGEWKDAEGASKGSELPPCDKSDPTATQTSPTYESWRDREYVYGPGDVDEFILEIDAQDNPIYMLQDANLNVVALYGFNSLTGAYGVLRQDVYTPYGELAATDLYTQELADSKVGFQGLFFNRLATSAQDTQLAPGAIGLYNARNRPYGPHIARFFTRDPNATGQLIIEIAEYHGGLVSSSLRALDIEILYADGSNRFMFTRSNPASLRDPMGLESWEDELLVTRDWDAIYDSIKGQGHAYLGVQGAATFGGFWGENFTVLPAGAMAAASLSEGFSDFADEYANQMIWLPVEGVFAGVGAFGRVAVAGRTATAAGRASRFARVASQIHKHHPIPRFLGGKAWQRLIKLPAAVHQELHKLIQERLVANGIPRHMLGQSTETWKMFMRDTPGAQRSAFDAVLEASRAIDQKYGTNVVQSVWEMILKGRFKSYM